MPNASISLFANVLFRTALVDPKTGAETPLSSSHNLILNSGMDMLPAGYSYADCFRNCSLGTGTKPTQRDSGAITFTRSGTTVTSSAGFFLSGDVGRILKFDTGERMTILAYTSNSVVEVDASGTLAAAPGTIWYVSETLHETEVARTSNVSNGTGDNGSNFLVDTWTHQRTFLFPAAGVDRLITEIGWSPFFNPGQTLFGRALIPAGGDGVPGSMQYKVTVYMTVKYPSAQVRNAYSSNGYNTSGVSGIEFCKMVTVRPDGSNDTPARGYWGNVLEPASPNFAVFISSDTAALSPMTGGPVVQPATTFGGWADAGYTATYTPGTYQRVFAVAFDVNSANAANHRSVWISDVSNSNFSMFRTLFDADQTKDNEHSLAFSWVITWDRAMVNT